MAAVTAAAAAATAAGPAAGTAVVSPRAPPRHQPGLHAMAFPLGTYERRGFPLLMGPASPLPCYRLPRRGRRLRRTAAAGAVAWRGAGATARAFVGVHGERGCGGQTRGMRSARDHAARGGSRQEGHKTTGLVHPPLLCFPKQPPRMHHSGAAAANTDAGGWGRLLPHQTRDGHHSRAGPRREGRVRPGLPAATRTGQRHSARPWLPSAGESAPRQVTVPARSRYRGRQPAAGDGRLDHAT